MHCEYCGGDKAIFWQNDANCAFVDNHGEMMIVANDKMLRFNVKNCPMCGRRFTATKYTDIKNGDDIWYVDKESNEIEHGKVFSVTLTKDKNHVDSFSVDFDNGDFDEFNGSALGVHYFIDEQEALDALRGTNCNE